MDDIDRYENFLTYCRNYFMNKIRDFKNDNKIDLFKIITEICNYKLEIYFIQFKYKNKRDVIKINDYMIKTNEFKRLILEREKILDKHK